MGLEHLLLDGEHHPGYKLVAGAKIAKGDELCLYYFDLRDDAAVVHYGYLPPAQDPPRLCLADHPAFNPIDVYAVTLEAGFDGAV